MIDDVLVVGGGVIGLATAEALAHEGLRVRVLETARVGSGASGAAAGMLAPINEVLESGAGDPDHPLLRLGLESLSRFAALCARLRDVTGIDAELEPSGLWRPVTSAAEEQRIGAGIERLVARWGAAVGALEWCSGSALGDALPGLSDGVRGAYLSPLECHLRPPLLVRALAAGLRARGGVIEEGIAAHRPVAAAGHVVGVETNAGLRRAHRVVLAAGPWTPGLLAAPVAGRDGRGAPAAPPIEPVRGQILALEAPLPALREIVFAQDVYCVPKRDGSWIVGATEERVGFDRRVTAEGVASLLARSRALFPPLEEASFVRAWAGLRPVARDGRPRVGAVEGVEGLFVAAGHGRNGVLLAPITAERLRDALLGKRPPAADLLADIEAR